MDTPSFLQLRSLVKHTGDLELSLAPVPMPQPTASQVLVRIDAAPINPSDIGVMLAGADIDRARSSGSRVGSKVTAPLSAGAMRAMAARVDISTPVGNEGAGLVVEAGSSQAAQALLGKTVALLGGDMYGQYRCIAADQCLVLPPGLSAAEGASAFVNPLTALGMISTMKSEGHTALVHTAAASNLGQMLNRLCLREKVALVNIVRKQEQADLLKAAGATHVCRSDSLSFMQDLGEALAATGATIAFDAIGGGPLAGQILAAMEGVLTRGAKHSRYGSTTHKQVYLYGSLDMSPTVLNRSYGMSWGIGGWLMTYFLQKIGLAATEALKQRVAAELKTTFASRYCGEISLFEALDLGTLQAYAKRSTGEKYLINPNRGL